MDIIKGIAAGGEEWQTLLTFMPEGGRKRLKN